MQALRQLGGGVIIAIISIILVLGGISLALAESASTPVPAQEAPISIPPTVQVIQTLAAAPAFSVQTETVVNTATFTSMPTLPPAFPTQCTPPGGWIPVIVGSSDTIYSLAQRYKTSEDALKNGNCLVSVELPVGSAIYVPFVPTVVVVPCSPPIGWAKTHVVQPGQNLFRIALSYGLTYPQLQQGNCMGSSTTIYTGQRLWVPNIPTLTPVPGVTITLVFPSSTASFTSMPPTATSTFISTVSPTPTASNTFAPADTQTPSMTPFP